MRKGARANVGKTKKARTSQRFKSNITTTTQIKEGRFSYVNGDGDSVPR